MSREYKNLSLTNIKAKSDGRIRVGVCAVMGNVDAWGDRIHPGAFTKTIAEQFQKASAVKHLWMHNSGEPPTALIKELRELTREELPAEVLLKAPDATGGLLVSREYLATTRGDELLVCVDAGAVTEMSFAFDVVKSANTEEDTGLADMPKRYIRELIELKLYDTSDVNWGMNDATVAAGAKDFKSLPLGVLLTHFQAYQKQFKAGSRNSGADLALINEIHNLARDLGAVCDMADEPKSDEPIAEEKQAEAVNDTSLSEFKQRFNQLRINNLKL